MEGEVTPGGEVEAAPAPECRAVLSTGTSPQEAFSVRPPPRCATALWPHSRPALRSRVSSLSHPLPEAPLTADAAGAARLPIFLF